MNIVETVGKIASLSLVKNQKNHEVPPGVSFEQIIDGENPVGEFLGNGKIDLVSDISKSFPDREPGPIGKQNARVVVKILDRSGFLDKMVESFISESGKSDWINEGQRMELKFKLGGSLVGQFSKMNWAEIFEYIFELSLKFKGETTGFLSYHSEEEEAASLFENLVSKMEDYLKEVGETVMGTT